MAEPSSSSLRWRDATARVPDNLSEIALPRNVEVAVVKWSASSSRAGRPRAGEAVAVMTSTPGGFGPG